MKSTRRFLSRRVDAERNGEVCLAGPDRAGQDQILWRRDSLAPGERVDLRRVDALGDGEIKRWRSQDSVDSLSLRLVSCHARQVIFV